MLPMCASGQVAVLSSASAESHAECRIMFIRARRIQHRYLRAIRSRTGVARSREVVALSALFRTRGASIRDATQQDGIPPGIAGVRTRAREVQRQCSPATHLVALFLAVCTLETRLVTALSPTVSPNRRSSTILYNRMFNDRWHDAAAAPGPYCEPHWRGPPLSCPPSAALAALAVALGGCAARGGGRAVAGLPVASLAPHGRMRHGPPRGICCLCALDGLLHVLLEGTLDGSAFPTAGSSRGSSRAGAVHGQFSLVYVQPAGLIGWWLWLWFRWAGVLAPVPLSPLIYSPY
jgi:hypothetical protein